MPRKIFVSYKYGDNQVLSMNKTEAFFLNGKLFFKDRQTRVRDYVDDLQKIIGKDNINLGEKDGESLEDFSDSAIETTLKNKIFNSSTTIVMISKGMKEITRPENEQWIPWEVSYSLKEIKRSDRTSRMNALLGIVLPDESGTYDWYYRHNPLCNSTTHKTAQLFSILKNNMFNIKDPTTRECNGTTINEGECSFIKTETWDAFKKNHKFYIDKAIEIRDKNELYNIRKKIE